MMDNCYYSAGPSTTNSSSSTWPESEKENFCSASSTTGGLNKNSHFGFGYGLNGPSSSSIPSKSSRKAELETLVTFLSKFDSKVAAIWDNGNGNNNGKSSTSGVWDEEFEEQEPKSPLMIGIATAVGPGPDEFEAEEEEDLLISPRTHFKPIRDYRDELPAAALTMGGGGPQAFLPMPQKDPAEYAIYHRTASSSFPLLFQLKSSALNDKAVQTNEEDILFGTGTGAGTTGTAFTNWLSPSPSTISTFSSYSSSSDSSCSPFYFTAGPSSTSNFGIGIGSSNNNMTMSGAGSSSFLH